MRHSFWRTIAEIKIPNLSAGSIEAAMKVAKGTARSMGIQAHWL